MGVGFLLQALADVVHSPVQVLLLGRTTCSLRNGARWTLEKIVG